MIIVSDKALRVATLSGAVVTFEPGVPRKVSQNIAAAALDMGAKVLQETPELVTQVNPEPEQVAVVASNKPEKTTGSLVDIMNAIIDEADPDNFKADGTPKASAINKAAGRSVKTHEREAAWLQAINS